MNFQDIVRLTGIDYTENNESYGDTYDLSWNKMLNESSEYKKIEVEKNGDKYGSFTVNDGVFYYYNKSTEEFKKVKYPNALPTLSNDSYEGDILENLTDNARGILNSSTSIFLADISTGYLQYNMKFLQNGKIKEEPLFGWENSDGSVSKWIYINVRPVIELQRNVKLKEVTSGNWDILS